MIGRHVELEQQVKLKPVHLSIFYGNSYAQHSPSESSCLQHFENPLSSVLEFRAFPRAVKPSQAKRAVELFIHEYAYFCFRSDTGIQVEFGLQKKPSRFRPPQQLLEPLPEHLEFKGDPPIRREKIVQNQFISKNFLKFKQLQQTIRKEEAQHK